MAALSTTPQIKTAEIKTPPVTTPHTALHLLGGFELRIDGQSIDLQPGIRKLLALVALSPRGVGRSFAAFQLWPDSTEDRARANLRSTLWRLGKLPVNIVVASKSDLRLDPDVWVDARHDAESLADGVGRAQQLSSRPFGSLSSDLLPDWYDDWLVVERERLRQQRLRTLEGRAVEMLGRGDSSGAIQMGLAAVAIDPQRESAHRLVIEAHLHEGNPSEARRQLLTYRHHLADDPDLAPSREIEHLCAGPAMRAIA